jgi:mannose-6-phosphate isomerase class I
MKNSDNVVRLGLTPKFKDVETLLKIIDYDQKELTPLVKNNHCY